MDITIRDITRFLCHCFQWKILNEHLYDKNQIQAADWIFSFWPWAIQAPLALNHWSHHTDTASVNLQKNIWYRSVINKKAKVSLIWTVKGLQKHSRKPVQSLFSLVFQCLFAELSFAFLSFFPPLFEQMKDCLQSNCMANSQRWTAHELENTRVEIKIFGKNSEDPQRSLLLYSWGI